METTGAEPVGQHALSEAVSELKCTVDQGEPLSAVGRANRKFEEVLKWIDESITKEAGNRDPRLVAMAKSQIQLGFLALKEYLSTK